MSKEAIKRGCENCPYNTTEPKKPEPTEFTKEARAYNFFDAEHPAEHRIIGIMNRLKSACNKIDRLTAENKKLKDAYNEIFENYIPAEKMDEANSKLILLLEPTERMARDMLKKHPLKGSLDENNR